MAIKAPTPPTPPTAPVVPGAESHTEASQSTVNNTSDNGKEFGVHVTISNPQQNQSSSPSQQSTSQQGAENTQGQSQQKTGQSAGNDAAQQARQDMVQQALGMKDGKADQQETQEAVQQNNPEGSWPLPGGHMSSMSFLPLLIVFIAAFIAFMLRNLNKKPRLKSQPPVKSQEKRAVKTRLQEKTTEDKDKKSKGSHFEMRI